MKKLISFNDKDLSFNSVIAIKRLKKARMIFKEAFLINILCLCLYLLGMKRNDIASLLDISENTVRAKARTFMRDGAPSLTERRGGRQSNSVMEEKAVKKNVIIEQKTRETIINLGDFSISIPENNPLQTRTVLLTLVQNNILSNSEAAKILNFTPVHIARLCKELENKDIHSLVDSRKGQKQDYRYTPDIKSELIQTVVLNCLAGEKTSGKSVGAELEEKFEVPFSERSVRHHMEKLGLNQLKKSLRERYDSVKKKSLK